jgi:hypothetical protein
MKLQDSELGRNDTAVSDATLRSIVEQGFFNSPGSLAHARSACAELILARKIIKSQAARLMQLEVAA